MKVWPGAHEATFVFTTQPGDGLLERPELDEEERRRLSHERAHRRAVGHSRRYIVANRLRYMWVLTIAGEGLHGAEGRAEVMRRVARFTRALRAELGHEFPAWWSPELHPGGHGWHMNFFVGRRVAHALVWRLWVASAGPGGPPSGHPWVKDWVKDDRVSALPFLERLRVGAGYGAKYAQKDWAAEMLDGGAHRYEVTQGFTPAVREIACNRLVDAVRLAENIMGRPPAKVSRSDEWKGWEGPPVWALTWQAIDPP